jgi:hypothetical protein
MPNLQALFVKTEHHSQSEKIAQNYVVQYYVRAAVGHFLKFFLLNKI